MKPEFMGVVARMYPNNSLSYLTEGLGNVFYTSDKGGSKYQVSNSMVIEWETETSQIKHVEYAESPTGTGRNKEEIHFYFREGYYKRFDIFRDDNTKQQFQVMYNPIRKSDNCWETIAILISNDYDSCIVPEDYMPGNTTTFQSTANVELSEEGYSKYQSSFVKHRNYMTTFRHDISWSALYAIQEDVFMRISSDKDKTKTKGIFKMVSKEKELLDTFMYSVSTGLLLNKGNVDINGKATHTDPLTNRPVFIGEGLIPQIERGADKYCYSNKPTLTLFNMIMGKMANKAQELTGNKLTKVAWVA